MSKSKVFAGKVNPFAQIVTDNAVCLGEIEFRDLEEGFIKTLRLYNQNARKHLYYPQFAYKDRIFLCIDYDDEWSLNEVKSEGMPVTFGTFESKKAVITRDFIASIPKKRVKEWDAVRYIH